MPIRARTLVSVAFLEQEHERKQEEERRRDQEGRRVEDLLGAAAAVGTVNEAVEGCESDDRCHGKRESEGSDVTHRSHSETFVTSLHERACVTRPRAALTSDLVAPENLFETLAATDQARKSP